MLNKLSLLLLLSTVFIACRKKDVTTVTAAKTTHTSKMGSVRNWHGSHYYTASGEHFPTPIYESWPYPDTSLALVVIDSATVQFMNDTFKYSKTDTANSIYFFGTANYYYSYGMGKGIAYYFAKDSIVYCNGDRHGTSDQWELRNLYYTY